MAKLCYVIRKPEQSKGIYYDWGEVKPLVTGVKGVEYKGFDDIIEAENYLNAVKVNKVVQDDGLDKNTLSYRTITGDIETRPLTNKEISSFIGKYDVSKPVDIYVDGSINDKLANTLAKNTMLGSGLLMMQEGVIIYETAFGKPHEHNGRNTESESWAVLEALKLMDICGFKEGTVYHDYQGLSSVITGEWKAKSETSLWYKDMFEKRVGDKVIHFGKVKGHTGEKYNERVDLLSKWGCLLDN